ncbi:hypothetical protein Q3V94_10055 [Caloramator sp. CAR-1]|uniref:hypothetical protein n=1 Tax=Caloramator sp. CAR-1 TaxID=3062777 RepID=UPI0026E3B32B|nr:hypothetical protein [Caloramator sp. CAR-1]MDO6355399.1 hypothetical protein [Caloramator sp. CAR-1]
MFREIIQNLERQYERYKNIYESIKKFEQEENINIEEYNRELQEISFNLEIIAKLSNRLEQLKEIYIIKHNISDFKAEEIERIELKEDVLRFKKLVEDVGNIIKETKRLQDKVISKLNKQLMDYNAIIKEKNLDKLVNQYKKEKKEEKSTIDVKK